MRDPHVKYPGFERNLYCHLDYDILIMLIGYIIVIDNRTGNPMLAIFVAYIIERIFRLLRSFIGQKNIAKKTFSDECFML